MSKPLSNIRIIDLTNVLAGPYCTYQLGLLGAQIVKIERPGSGDLARQLGADPIRSRRNMGISFLAQNAGKRSLTLNLKDKKGRSLLKKLVGNADVLVENFRPGVMSRLGLGYSDLKQVNPHLIYCAISGFGQDGPWRDNPAYDQIVQGVSGVMSITGTEAAAPLRVGYPLGDTIGGMTAAYAIAAALNQKPRGAFVDISMTDSVLSTMGWVVSNHLIGGIEPAAHGNENTTSAPSGTFRTADQPVNIAANKDEQWVTLAKLLEREDWLELPQFATREDRKSNREALRHTIEAELVQQPAAHWVKVLNENGVPCGQVMTVPQVLQSPQISERSLITRIDSDEGPLDLTASPAVFDGVRPAPEAAPPALGQNTPEILQDLGLNEEEIAELKKEGVI